MRKLSAYEINQLNKHNIDPYFLDLNSIDNKPVEYITGFAEFYGRDFIVNENTLIPRIETERIIDLAFENLPEGKVDFIDVGTGSGAIGITFAKELERKRIEYRGILSDSLDEALNIARSNIKKLKAYSLEPVTSNLFTSVSKQKFNTIFANLPYIPTSRISTLASSVKDFEPVSALDGGEDGLDLIRKLIYSTSEYLEKDGVLILEVDDTHTHKFSEEFIGWEIEIFTDLNGKNRFWVCKINS
ncbi:peptide chain release factor N(5)-glutamine methyltransferase [Candidatus Dojkabacteria bacterium]|uniref:peptide chain release factor N(5)-glutamine methyltransferase n=1 Tax=Candidatus Dojkabacteria bacterium TaxID=2099670 RepID=A0A955L9J0_9BACT|nr:peptide chain release factor N(5)-glutamine methyltransferase [Candidatus Dojkabacteria bacterium]